MYHINIVYAVKIMTITTSEWDLSDHIKNNEDAARLLNLALEEGDESDVASVLGAIARSKGMTKIARQCDLSRESLYRALSADGNPSLGTILKVMKAVNVKLTAKPAA
jgi:probable addiction module antidote protein